MSRYRRVHAPGGIFFLTLVTYRRRAIFVDAAARLALREALLAAGATRPFELLQLVLLPDHLHVLMHLPADDADFSCRVSAIKTGFTRRWLGTSAENQCGVTTPAAVSASRRRQRYRDVWQKRFWEHWIRSDDDLARCEAYCWYNPVKHGLARCPHEWPWNTFHREVSDGRMRRDWWCVCDGRSIDDGPPVLNGAEPE